MPEITHQPRPVANGLWESTNKLRDQVNGDQQPDRDPQPWDSLMDLPPGPHVARLAVWAGQLRRWGVTITEDIWQRMVDDALGAANGPAQQPLPEGPTIRERATTRAIGTVYYLRIGNVIKIGVTRNVEQRMMAYPPNAVLLATETGDEYVEVMRHEQFAADLAHGREWFHPSAALIEHINALRGQPLTAAELAA